MVRRHTGVVGALVAALALLARPRGTCLSFRTTHRPAASSPRRRRIATPSSPLTQPKTTPGLLASAPGGESSGDGGESSARSGGYEFAGSAALEEEAPLPEIRWLAIDPTKNRGKEVAPSGAAGTTVLPLFPLGPVAYTPGSQQVLNIFEPRYRQMYSDILLSGSRRFVTTMVNPESASEIAEVGVVLYLDDLKEVSQQTNDAIKYVCSHKVLDQRVAIVDILNPADAATKQTYMRCEVRDVVDADAEGTIAAAAGEDDVAAMEAKVAVALAEIAEMQEASEEDVRFSREAVRSLRARRGVGDGSLWGVVELWKNFLDARAQAASRKVQADMQGRLIKFLTEQQRNESESGSSGAPAPGTPQFPRAVNLADLPEDLQRDVKNLKERVMDDVGPLVDEMTKGVQRLLQAESHVERLSLFLRSVENEKRRLIARRTLKSTLSSLERMMGGGSSDGGGDATPEGDAPPPSSSSS